MARYQQQRFPIGSVSTGTMRPEDLIPTFTNELEYQLKHTRMSSAQRKSHSKLVREITARIQDEREFSDEDLGIEGAADYDLESLFDALECYAGPYFYFGAHPGDGADYGYWLSESWDEDFVNVFRRNGILYANRHPFTRSNYPESIKVSNSADIPSWFRGDVAMVSDHGNVTLYVKTARTLREV